MGFRPVVSIVIDPGNPHNYYDLPVRQIYAVADIMIRLGDSTAMKSKEYFRFADWKAHVDLYLKKFVGFAKYWEVANEPNQPESFIGKGAYDKFRYAQDACKAAGQTTVATYLLGERDDVSPGCYYADYINAHPLAVDLALASFYPFQITDDLPKSMPAFRDPFTRMMTRVSDDLLEIQKLVPSASGIGFGEFGGELEEDGRFAPKEIRAEICRQVYCLTIPGSKYIRGGFYWDYVRDCVRSKTTEIQDAIVASCKPGGIYV